MTEKWLVSKLNCSYEEKMECIKNVSSVLEWIRECIKHKNFDFEIPNNSNTLFKKSVSLMYSGKSTEHIFNIMYNYVITKSINSKEFLENISILSMIICFLKLGKYPYL